MIKSNTTMTKLTA